MDNVILTIHLILALCLIGVVLLQRSEGGGLGIGGGGNAGVSARGTATALTKLTWILAVAFIITSLTLTILATRGAGNRSVIDDGVEAVEDTPLLPGLTGDLTPPTADDAPAPPPRADEPAPADTAPANNP
jgi:preprotein translocase subunit SecG